MCFALRLKKPELLELDRYIRLSDGLDATDCDDRVMLGHDQPEYVLSVILSGRTDVDTFGGLLDYYAGLEGR